MKKDVIIKREKYEDFSIFISINEAKRVCFARLEIGIDGNYEPIILNGQEVIGYAYCNPNDIFMPEVGIDLAALRVKRVFNRFRKKYSENKVAEYNNKLNMVEEEIEDIIGFVSGINHG